MSEPGKRADGGVHTWIVCPDCHAGVRASRHSPEDCDSLFAAMAELAAANNVAQALEDSAQEVRVKLAEANAKIARVRRVHVTLEMATKLAAIAGAKSTTNVLEAIVTELFAALHPQGSSV